jgi:Flp pilus assembly protein TadB
LASGGNLADTTDRLSQSLVERSRVRRRARTIVSYSRMATQILLVLPLAAILIMSSVLDGYADLLLNRQEGNVILGLAALMVVAGLVLAQRFGRIDDDRRRRSA